MGLYMNKIEKSIVNGLNGVTSSNGAWKLFSSRNVNSNMELKNEKEKKLYSALCEFLSDKDTSISVLPCNKFTTMFIDWSNEKLIELPSVLVDVKMIEKCLKFYFLENHLTLNRYFCLCMHENDDKVYITSVCRESAIYRIKEVESKETEETEEESATTEEGNTLLKIATLLNSVYALSKDLDNTTKKSIVDDFIKSMKVVEVAEVVKKSAIA